MKKDPNHHQRYKTRRAVRSGLFEYIETFYNRIRKHSALGYQRSIQFAKAT
ncbi:MAG: IS3 family transposase [Planctomycetaceae bacterium]|nr:IS3 family transposase [Planctomycetaceae bacterium]